MLKFITKTLIFLCLAAICDLAVGHTILWMEHRAKVGQSRKNLDILEEANPDILVLGSSRAMRHYVPQILEDSLGMTAFVAGQDAHGIVSMNPTLHYMGQRHKPKIVIYDLISNYDYIKDNEETYLGDLRQLWGRNAHVDSVICSIDPAEKYKQLSMSYRYNSTIFMYLMGMVGSSNNFDRGYSPHHETIDSVRHKNITVIGRSPAAPSKIALLKDLVAYCRNNGIKLYFYVSPYYHYEKKNDASLIDTVRNLGYKVTDYSHLPEFASASYFFDPVHLNEQGARKYTRMVASDLKQSLKESGTATTSRSGASADRQH